MNAFEYLKKLKEITPKPTLVETDKLPFDDGLFLGVWHGDFVYCDKYMFKHPKCGLRGWALVCFKVKDKKLISIDIVETQAHTLTFKEIEEQITNNMANEIAKTINATILKEMQNRKFV